MSVIQFNEASLSFAGHNLFQHASFSVLPGERCGLVGRNGSGKSTLFRLITGELELDKGNIEISKHYRIGYLQQHISFSQTTLLSEAASGLREEERDHVYKAEKILFGLGFSQTDLEVAPSQFSGGYQLRLHLAKVLLAEPDCLLLDEPTNYLDIVSIRWLSNFLSRWKREFILISHDRTFMDSVTTHTIGIHREKVRKLSGSSIDFFNQILLEEEIHERTRVKVEKKRSHLQSYIDRFGAKASKATQAQSRKKILAREPALERLNDLSHLQFSFKESPFPGKQMLEAKHLQFSFSEKPLIEDFSIEIEKGERVALIGKNGRGKSTLLRLLGGDLTPQQGSIKSSNNLQLGFFGQTHVDRLQSHQTIEESIAQANPSLSYTEVKSIAGLMMFSGSQSQKKISVLSGGERARVLLGKLVARPCNLLLLDEPTHHLDIESIEALIDALEDFAGSLVIVTHSELMLRRLALDKVVICEEGRQTMFLGDYDEFLEKRGWEEKNKPAAPSRLHPKKERAERLAKRSVVMKPIEREIARHEAHLSCLEAQHSDETALLATGSPELLKAFGLRQKEIEQTEESLLKLYELLEQKKGEFDAMDQE